MLFMGRLSRPGLAILRSALATVEWATRCKGDKTRSFNRARARRNYGMVRYVAGIMLSSMPRSRQTLIMRLKGGSRYEVHGPRRANVG